MTEHPIAEMKEAINACNLPHVCELIAQHPELLQYKDSLDSTFLHSAAELGHIDLCKVLIGSGIHIDAPAESDKTPAAWAAGAGQTDAVRWLLDHGAAVDGLPTSTSTPLMAASASAKKGDHLEVARLLLDRGADPNREHLRSTALATALGHAEFFASVNPALSEVAALLRERGGTHLYLYHTIWTGRPGEKYIEHIEHTFGRIGAKGKARGIVSPLGYDREVAPGRTVTIRKTRFEVKTSKGKVTHLLLFTVGNAHSAGAELAFCTQIYWPFNRDSLKLPYLSWPVDLLSHMSQALHMGASLNHGDIIDEDHPAAAGFVWQQHIPQLIAVRRDDLESEHDGIPPTLLLCPVKLSKRLKTKTKAAQDYADKRRATKWNSVAVGYVPPICLVPVAGNSE